MEVLENMIIVRRSIAFNECSPWAHLNPGSEAQSSRPWHPHAFSRFFSSTRLPMTFTAKACVFIDKLECVVWKSYLFFLPGNNTWTFWMKPFFLTWSHSLLFGISYSGVNGQWCWKPSISLSIQRSLKLEYFTLTLTCSHPSPRSNLHSHKSGFYSSFTFPSKKSDYKAVLVMMPGCTRAANQTSEPEDRFIVPFCWELTRDHSLLSLPKH